MGISLTNVSRLFYANTELSGLCGINVVLASKQQHISF